MKMGPDAPGTAENESGRSKRGLDALGTDENEFGSAKHEKYDLTLSVPPKTSPSAQNMKTGPNALGTVENEFGRGKHENGTRHSRHRQKRVWEHKS
jgi:hypothetical protein